MRWILSVLCVCGALLGCGSNPGPSRPSVEAESAPPPPPPPVGEVEVTESPAPPGSQASPGRQAEVGVGRKGHGYGTGPVATPLAARWRAAERLVFNVQIPQAMNLFKATNGRAPGSHEEFMKEIINANRIDLPELPEGERYQYDPEAEQLMVIGKEGQ